MFPPARTKHAGTAIGAVTDPVCVLSCPTRWPIRLSRLAGHARLGTVATSLGLDEGAGAETARPRRW